MENELAQYQTSKGYLPLRHAAGARFWFAVLLTGACTGISAAVLARLLEAAQQFMCPGSGSGLLVSAEGASAWRHVLVLLTAGLVTGAGQMILKRLSSGNGTDTTAAIWFHAGRMPALRTLGSAVLSVLIVAMGVSLGREGAPKQAGAVFANFFSDRGRLSAEQRRLLVACGAGAGMGAAYGVPLSIWFPQLLGNGKDISQWAFTGQVTPILLGTVLILKPAATALCIRCGAPGGLFTPSLTVGAMLGGVLGYAWSGIWPGVPAGLFAPLGAGAVLAATTQGPISSVVLMMELTGRDRSFILPLLLACATATLVARTIEPRSIYDARLTSEEIRERSACVTCLVSWRRLTRQIHPVIGCVERRDDSDRPRHLYAPG